MPLVKIEGTRLERRGWPLYPERGAGGVMTKSDRAIL